MSSRANLEREAANWMRELPAPPPGNGPQRELWEGPAAASAASADGSMDAPAATAGQLDTSLMSPAERAGEQRGLLRSAERG